MTLHRPSNVDDAKTLGGIIDALEAIGERLPIVFPVHPRTRERLEQFNLSERIGKMKSLLDDRAARLPGLPAASQQQPRWC